MGAKGANFHLARESGMSTLHPDILNDAQRASLPAIGKWASDEGFYLGGGTAVALYFGHRRSVDFDWFTPDKIEDPIVLAERARESGLRLRDVQVAPSTLHGLVEEVRVSFFEYPYPQIADFTAMPDHGIALASLDDLACMKLAAIAQRGSRKDFIDFYVIALRHRPLKDAIELYRRKYSIEDVAHLLVGLTYFDDADDEPMPVMLSDVSWDEVKRLFREWAKALAG